MVADVFDRDGMKSRAGEVAADVVRLRGVGVGAVVPFVQSLLGGRLPTDLTGEAVDLTREREVLPGGEGIQAVSRVGLRARTSSRVSRPTYVAMLQAILL